MNRLIGLFMHVTHNKGEFETRTERNGGINMEGNKPEIKFRAGGISATVWQNQGQSRTGEAVSFKTISIDRRYRDKDGTWKSTNSLRINDLPKAELVIKKAYEHVVLKGNYNEIEEVVM